MVSLSSLVNTNLHLNIISKRVKTLAAGKFSLPELCINWPLRKPWICNNSHNIVNDRRCTVHTKWWCPDVDEAHNKERKWGSHLLLVHTIFHSYALHTLDFYAKFKGTTIVRFVCIFAQCEFAHVSWEK